jgi:hypothetical protein
MSLHRGQKEHISNSPRTSIRHNTSSRPRNVPLIEGTSNSMHTIHTEALDELVHLQEHSTPSNHMSWAFVRGHVRTRTRKYSDQPSFITPADLTLTVAVLWVALVAHVSMDPTAFRRRMFCFCTKRRGHRPQYCSLHPSRTISLCTLLRQEVQIIGCLVG